MGDHHMGGPGRFPASGHHGGQPPEPEPARSGPRWGLILGIAVAVAVALMILLHLTGALGPGVH
jgi:hypothetical protein